jgi:DNA-binding MarR family transcriptional regulator
MEATTDRFWDLFQALSFIRQQSRALSRTETELDGVSVGLLSLAAQRAHLRPSEVAEELQLHRSMVSRQLQALESAGAIRLVADPDDGRSWRVEVLPAGFAQLREFREAIVRIYGELLDDWPSEDVARLTTLLTRLGESMARRPRPRRPARVRRERS